ncbi:7TM GPCR, serpentine receptor class j (Srj) family-containing protein [Strongyloides ratti]|uniref:7TM GPCR, serpentine receptor class j (Srj) family-containing protein n=1 Tax=Strongyloides ratti TaxID=34506 RepID=A0A090L599_STRRB|nr:7TM GPCR, serpentine receptor class j (Srj) family-containing protein [Strongyloides ratti]CEF64902.1 7TM GPCR, serpentine receptor class j (Srj) family-containing protein [Strongyloides ratti]
MCSIEGQILILEIHKYSTYVLEVFGLLFNFLVVYFLFTDKKSSVTSYKTAVIIHCVMDIGLGIMHILGMFQIELVGTTTFMTLTGPIQFINNYFIHTISFIITNFFFSCSIFCGILTVIYRYLVLVKKRTLEMFHIIAMFIPIATVAGIIASQYILYFAPLTDEEYKKYTNLLDKRIWARDKFYGENFVTLVSPASHKTSPFHTYFPIICYALTAIATVIFSLLIAIHLKKNRSNMSESTLKLERQIQITLVVQALLPIFLGFLPNILPILMVLFNVPFQCYIIFVGVCITYVPLVNPCVLLFMTPQFRRRILNFFKKKNIPIQIKTITNIIQ